MARENTRCVQIDDYESPNFTAEVIGLVASLLWAIPTLGASLTIGWAAAISALRKVLEYALYGKLVCLDGDRCAIGWVVEIEPVGYRKPFPDDIDDDFSLNILLAPVVLADFELPSAVSPDVPTLPFVADPDDPKWDEAKRLNRARFQGPQDDLLYTPPELPEPRDPKEHFGDTEGYYTWFVGPQIGTRYIDDDDNQIHIPATTSPTPFPMPVLHVECEGSRSKTLLDVLDNFPPGTKAVCDIPLLGPIACAIAAAIGAPILIVLLAIAWFAADEGDPADVGDGTVAVGDLVILKGRRVWDGGHSGWPELHPLKILQKIPVSSSGADPWAGFASFEAFRDEWCRKLSQPPPRPRPDPDTTPGGKPEKPAGMTPEQEEVWEAQQQAENDWVVHPDIDGCQPPAPEPDPPDVPH